ncbi:glycosyltransferase [Aquibacillus albus]|uniref:Glycosyltransferase involved in cell wall biosynthesis n=1 Tax=Aquibacillus albus TaxID=1168171 RepID=A0ABS2MZW3_9BACI|nr:glycosyltransferase [Aquibacillus albus]MBM7571381.1 glycosyltransferase involved in cell wall biosynthesis [Aquibacillus albus]
MNRKHKVMQIIPNLGLAGAEVMVENLAVSLKDKGYRVSVVSLYNEKSVITTRLENKNVPLFYLGKKKGLDIKIIFKLFKLFLKERPTIVHTHRYAMQYVIPAASLARIPIRVHTIHNVAVKEVSKSQRLLHYFFFKYCKVIPVSISPLVKKSVIEEYKFIDSEVEMIYNGINLEKCIPKSEYLSNGDISLLHIGRFTEQKNHIGLIESFKIVNDSFPNTTLQLIGSGDLENEIRKKIKELNLEHSVQILGLKSQVYPYLNKADIFVLPSHWEGMPITLIEAMGTALPIVATEVGGIPDMIKSDVSGLLVNVDKESIAKALLKLVKNAPQRQKLGNRAKIDSEHFSVQVMQKHYSNIYETYYSKFKLNK